MKEDDALPGIYFYHGKSGKTVRFDLPFEASEITSFMLQLWVRSEMLETDIVALTDFIERYTAQKNLIIEGSSFEEIEYYESNIKMHQETLFRIKDEKLKIEQ